MVKRDEGSKFKPKHNYPSIDFKQGFCGYVESVSKLHSLELCSILLYGLVDDNFKLAKVEQMLSHILKEIEIMKSSIRDTASQHIASTIVMKYVMILDGVHGGRTA
ncbi:hypothetical protein MTR_4g124795 [Medicago truncatula]|uniref:Uncharacterized protein n=1 Tax=Medicago truncatula TaxID=3880 RepID=A0A072URK8_MEDTR|nr:hypothetical protein MTR_4g124795 [Medicago truncatula]